MTLRVWISIVERVGYGSVQHASLRPGGPNNANGVEHVAVPVAEWGAREAYVKELERAIMLARACGEVVACRAFDAVVGEAKENR